MPMNMKLILNYYHLKQQETHVNLHYHEEKVTSTLWDGQNRTVEERIPHTISQSCIILLIGLATDKDIRPS